MAGYIGTTPVPQATQHRESFTATGGQTSFATVGYTPQFIDVYLNGVKLAPADFTATNGSDVVLASGATASDILEIVAYTPFEIASQTFTGDTTANNFAVTGTFTSRGIDDNADAVAITIDSSENVGIGTSSPAEKLDITTAGTTRAFIKNTNLTSSGMYIGEDSTGQQILGSGAYPMRFGTNNTERMRIDSSGNLLVGGITTLPSSSVNGFGVLPTGIVVAAVSNDKVTVFNRNGTDGDISLFQKDNSTVGDIGTSGGYFFINGGNSGGTHAGLRFINNASIRPCNTTGNDLDATLALGTANARFKDLYLSGGVYLGGTGSANKLEDYEFGFFLPTYTSSGTNPSGVTYDPTVGNEGRYTKIGGVVHIQINIRTDAISNKGTGNLNISGLPFASAGYSSQGGYSVFTCQGDGFLSNQPSAAQIGENSTTLGILYRTVINGGLISSQTSDLNTGSNDNLLRISGTYMTEE